MFTFFRSLLLRYVNKQTAIKSWLHQLNKIRSFLCIVCITFDSRYLWRALYMLKLVLSLHCCKRRNKECQGSILERKPQGEKQTRGDSMYCKLYVNIHEEKTKVKNDSSIYLAHLLSCLLLGVGGERTEQGPGMPKEIR